MVLPLLTLAAAMLTPTHDTPPAMKWWTEARFGMFIHWDMSSIAGTEISWSRKGSKPLDIFGDPAGYVEDPVYDNLYKKFNPTQFRPDDWAKAAKNAGMKYVVFTSKHHGGFSMFHTKYSDYGIANSPFHRDILKELVTAFRKQGLRIGIYYSPRDWHQPDYGATDASLYHRFLMGQLTELLTHYGHIDVMWFDSFGHGDSVKYWKADEMLALVRHLQPGIVVNNRSAFFGDGNPALQGDFDTPEQRLGEFQNTRPWESCMTIVRTAEGGGWSYRPDGVVRSKDECIRSLASCACGDGNLLLDVGPDSTGVIPSDQLERLRDVGQWMKVNHESITKTHGGPYRNGKWGGTTYRGNTVYVHLFSPIIQTGKLPALPAKVLSAQMLGGLAIPFLQTSDGLSFDLSHVAFGNPDVVIKLQLDRPASELMPNGKPIEVP